MKTKVLLIAAIALMTGCASGLPIEGDQRADADTLPPQTGSRIPRNGDTDSPRDVQVIDKDDIEASGAINVEDAIRRRGNTR